MVEEKTFDMIFVWAVTPNYVARAGTRDGKQKKKKKKRQEITLCFLLLQALISVAWYLVLKIENANYFFILWIITGADKPKNERRRMRISLMKGGEADSGQSHAASMWASERHWGWVMRVCVRLSLGSRLLLVLIAICIQWRDPDGLV